MDVYGLTGGIGSGKSAVAELLERYGVPVVSADELSRIVVAPGSEGLREVVAAFGEEVLDERGQLDRRHMARIVFKDPAKRRELESILHPKIRERYEQVLDALEKVGHQVAVYEVPLLFEKNLQGEMKAVILVTADERARIERVKARDDITETEVRGRMAAQMDEDQKRRRADYVIENDGSMDDLRREVEFMLSRFMRLPIKRKEASLPEVSPHNNTAEIFIAGRSPLPTGTRPPVPPPAAAPPAPSKVVTQPPPGAERGAAQAKPSILPKVPPPPPPPTGSQRRAVPPLPPPVTPPSPKIGSAPSPPPQAVDRAPPPPPPRTRPNGQEADDEGSREP